MAKKKPEAKKPVEKPAVKPVVIPIVQPEVEGAKRDEYENPLDQAESTPKVETQGNWIKATHAELCKYEADGVLCGYRQETSEVLLKGE